MTVYPFVLHLGPIEITGYGLMLVAAFAVAGWLMQLELRRLGLNENFAGDSVVAAVIGGIIGAKLWYVALYRDPGALFSRGGLVWYGGFIGGAVAVLLNAWRLRVPLRWTMHVAGPALPAAYAVGRVGCFLVGDDYGRPTDLPWGMKFPQGLPPSTAGNLQQLFGVSVPAGVDPGTVLAVHPTQLYEVFIMLAVFVYMWPRRKLDKPVGWMFGLYLVFAGLERFFVEIFRAKDDRFFGPFTLAQVTSVALVLIGAAILNAWKRDPRPDPGPYL
ncbi:MAG: prolipoprotein diacylglyceryl transferase, partial [Gemmatimonadota bacterium]